MILKKKRIIILALLGVIGMLIVHFILPRVLISGRFGGSKFSIPKDVIGYQKLSCISYDGHNLEGMYLKPEIDSLHTTVILLHGIRGTKEYCLSKALRLVNEGFSILLIDLRGHGESGGDYCTFGVKEKQDISSWIDLIPNKEHKIGVWGQSLGGAVALQAMAYDDRIQFGIIESTFSHFKSVGPDYVERLLKINIKWFNDYLDWRVGDIADFKTEEASPYVSCKSIKQPIVMVHGNEDANINVKYGRMNYKALKSIDKRYIEVEGASHVDVYKKIHASFFSEMVIFMKTRGG